VTPNQYRDRQGAVLAAQDDPESGKDHRVAGTSPHHHIATSPHQSAIDNRQSHIDNPIVIATRRLDNGPPDVVEIVLDTPIPYNATTRFTFNDGTLSQSLEFTYSPGDIDGDGQATLSDLAAFQNCFGSNPLIGVCPVLDFDQDGAIDLSDLALFAE
jgi:hypothetical protein